MTMNMEERTYRYRECFVLTISTLLSSFFLFESIQIFLQRPEADAPGTFPLLLSALMVPLNAALFVGALRGASSRAQPFSSHFDAIKASIQEELPHRVTVSFFATTAYIAFMWAVGFAVSTFLFLLSLTVYLDRGRWKTALLSSAAVTAAIYVVFGLIFRVRL